MSAIDQWVHRIGEMDRFRNGINIGPSGRVHFFWEAEDAPLLDHHETPGIKMIMVYMGQIDAEP